MSRRDASGNRDASAAVDRRTFVRTASGLVAAAAFVDGCSEGSAGGGPDKVTANGANQMLAIELAPEVVDPDDIEMLQDLIISAVNEALRIGEENREKVMSALTPAGMGGLL